MKSAAIFPTRKVVNDSNPLANLNLFILEIQVWRGSKMKETAYTG